MQTVHEDLFIIAITGYSDWFLCNKLYLLELLLASVFLQCSSDWAVGITNPALNNDCASIFDDSLPPRSLPDLQKLEATVMYNKVDNRL